MRLRWRRDRRSFGDRYYERLAEDAQRRVERGADLGGALQAAAESVGAGLDASAGRLADDLVRRSPRMLRERGRMHRGFAQRLRPHWGPGLDRLYLLVVCCEEAGSDFYAGRVAGRGEYPRRQLHEALAGLHARASRTALEVHHLMSGGYGKGALARCRTLHELAVVAMVLQAYGGRPGHEELAERFVLHDAVASWRDAQTYQEHWRALGVERLSDEAMAKLRSRRDDLVRRFGEDYRREYGWAAGVDGVARPNFSDLERLAGVQHLRGYYRWASHEVHADAKGSVLNLVERGGVSFKHSGPSNVGLADPGQLAAASLHQATVALLLSADPLSPRDLMVLQAMQLLVSDANEALVAGERSVQEAEERYQARGPRVMPRARPRPGRPEGRSAGPS